MRLFFQGSETGGAALEYIVVSIFGLLIAIGAVKMVQGVAEEKLRSMEDKLGIQLNIEDLKTF